MEDKSIGELTDFEYISYLLDNKRHVMTCSESALCIIAKRLILIQGDIRNIRNKECNE